MGSILIPASIHLFVNCGSGWSLFFSLGYFNQYLTYFCFVRHTLKYTHLPHWHAWLYLPSLYRGYILNQSVYLYTITWFVLTVVSVHCNQVDPIVDPLNRFGLLRSLLNSPPNLLPQHLPSYLYLGDNSGCVQIVVPGFVRRLILLCMFRWSLGCWVILFLRDFIWIINVF